MSLEHPRSLWWGSLPIAQPKESSSLHLSHWEEYSPDDPHGVTAFLTVQRGCSAAQQELSSLA